MSIVSMKLVEILVPRPMRRDLLACLQDFGRLQLEEVALVVRGTRSFLHRDTETEEEAAEERHLRGALRQLEEIDPLFAGSPWPSLEKLDEVHEEIRSEKPE